MIWYYLPLDPLILGCIFLAAVVWKGAAAVAPYFRKSAASHEIAISRSQREEVSRPKSSLQTVVSSLAGKPAKTPLQQPNPSTKPKYDTLEYVDEIEFRLIDIELYRKDNTEPLTCRRRKTTAANAGVYYALSYCWNNEPSPTVLGKQRPAPSNTASLSVDGERWAVGSTLYAALLAIRAWQGQGSFVGECNAWTTVAIWADAICIDQYNFKERARQVVHMRNIYAGAESVLGYVGRPWSTASASSPSTIFRDLSILAQEDPRSWNNRRQWTRLCLAWESQGVTRQSRKNNQYKLHFSDHWLDDVGWISSSSNPDKQRYLDLQHEFKESYTKLMQSGFWKRRWIIQEVAAASTITLLDGEHSLNWDTLGSLTENVASMILMSESESSTLLAGFQRLQQIRTWFADRPLHLVEVMYVSYDFDCGRPQDQIYALLGLAWNSATFVRFMSYMVPGDRIVWDMTLTYFRQTRTLDFICLRGNPHPDRSISLPSWAPDWRFLGNDDVRRSVVEYLRKDTGSVRWSASRYPKAVHYDLKKNGELKINCRRLSTICSLLGAPKYWKSSTRGMQLHAEDGIATASPGDQQVGDAIYETLTVYSHAALNELEGQDLLPLGDIFSADYQQLCASTHPSEDFWSWIRDIGSVKIFGISIRDRLKSFRPSPMLFQEQGKTRTRAKPMFRDPRFKRKSQGEHNAEVLSGLQCQYRQKMRFMVTSEGGCGWAHADAQPGDEVTLLEGCSFPVVLREATELPWSHHEAHIYQPFQVVGHAYLAGAMYGARWTNMANVIREKDKSRNGKVIGTVTEMRDVAIDLITLV